MGMIEIISLFGLHSEIWSVRCGMLKLGQTYLLSRNCGI